MNGTFLLQQGGGSYQELVLQRSPKGWHSGSAEIWERQGIITANSPREAEILQKHDDEWVSVAFTGASLMKQTCQLLITGIFSLT